jgi:hypothetical protein
MGGRTPAVGIADAGGWGDRSGESVKAVMAEDGNTRLSRCDKRSSGKSERVGARELQNNTLLKMRAATVCFEERL